MKMGSSIPNSQPPSRKGNLSYLPLSDSNWGNIDSPSGGGYGNGMEARIARLEAHVEHMGKEMTEVKKDLRQVLYVMLAGAVLLLTAFGWGFTMLRGDINAMNAKLDASISQINAKADASTAAILAKLE